MTPSLYWLPEVADWRGRVSAFQQAERPAWSDAVTLARARLGFTQTNGLDGAVRTALDAGRITDAPTPLKLAIIGSSTLTHLHAGIRVAGLRRAMRIETFETEFGQHLQALLDPASALHAFRPDVVLFAFDAPWLTRDGSIDGASEELVGLWRMARDAFGCLVIQQTAMNTAPPILGQNEHRLPSSPAALIHAINARLRDTADAESVDLLALDAQVEQDGLAAWHSRGQWLRARQDVSPTAGPMYGELLARLVAARRGLSAKCLVLDLDDTLWGGVVGDDGVSGLRLGQGSGEGEAYQDIQRHALSLAQRGVILAVASKNDEATVIEAFDTHPDMVLKREHIACMRANWNDKPGNLVAIAETLNIGLDALVFLDDNPVERDLVRRTLPMVAVPEWPGDPALVPRLLADAGYFEGVGVTDEDRARTGYYAGAAQTQALKARATDLAAYLRDLDMTLSWSPVDEAGLARAVQLINKTNQFNLTTRRTTEDTLRRTMADPDALVLQFRLADRFVDNGVISIVVARREADAMIIDTWLMSCRVLGREVERAVLDVAAAAAESLGAARLIGEYVPTERNGMVADLYPQLGFNADAMNAGRFTLDLAARSGTETPIKIVRTAS